MEASFILERIPDDDVDHPTFGHGLRGVSDQIVQDLQNLILVDPSRPQVRLQVGRAQRIGPRQGKIDRELDQRPQSQILLVGKISLGEGQQLMRQGLGPVEDQGRLVEIPHDSGIGLALVSGQRQIAKDSPEEIVEIVGDSARQRLEESSLSAS